MSVSSEMWTAGLSNDQVLAAQKAFMLQMLLRVSGVTVFDPYSRSSDYACSPHFIVETFDALQQFSLQPHVTSISPCLDSLFEAIKHGHPISEVVTPLNLVVCGDSSMSMKEGDKSIPIPELLEAIFSSLGLGEVVVHNLARDGV